MARTRAMSGLFWTLYRGLVQPDMPRGGIDVFGCNQRARDQLVALNEAHSSLVGQLIWIGMRRAEVPYRRQARRQGRSGWTLRKKVSYMLDSCLSFSDLPIRLLFAVGCLALVVALGYSVVVLVARLTGLIAEPGYATTVLLIAGFGALNALGLAVVGAYAWRAFENTKSRPLSIVQRRFSFGDAAMSMRREGRSIRPQGRPKGEVLSAHREGSLDVCSCTTALCESTSVGTRTRIWAFAHVLPGARIGADCNICDHTFIENDVTSAIASP